MSDGPTSISLAIRNIKSCLESNDVAAATFLRDGLIESIASDQTWLTQEEEEFLASY